MEYYVENKFKTDDEELIETIIAKIAEEIIKRTFEKSDGI